MEFTIFSFFFTFFSLFSPFFGECAFLLFLVFLVDLAHPGNNNIFILKKGEKKNIFYIKLAHKIKALKNASNIKQLKKISFEKKNYLLLFTRNEIWKKKITSYFFVLLKKRVCNGASRVPRKWNSDKTAAG